MGDRIVIRIADGKRSSPDLYCHWLGMRAIPAVDDALLSSRDDVYNIMCNAVIKTMQGVCKDASFYIMSAGEAEGMADWDNWTWELDIRDRTWTSTAPQLEGRKMMMEEAERIASEGLPRPRRDGDTHHGA